MKTLLVLFFTGLLGYNSPGKNNHPPRIIEEVGYNAYSDLIPGIPAFEGTTIEYKREGKSMLTVRLEDPGIVSVATKPEKWGFFQFPFIYRSLDNAVVATWNMAPDAVTSYGKGGSNNAISVDGGKSWSSSKGNAPIGRGLLLPGGDLISIGTPKALDTTKIKLPKPVAVNKEAYGRNFVYYKLSELPDVLKGVYINRFVKGGNSWVSGHNVLDDPQAVRYTDSGMFPVVWWGDMRIAADGALIAGIYPGFYLEEDGKVNASGIFFYRSTDEGHTWKIQGRIPYAPDLKTDPNGDKRLALGFTEPGFEILSDGTFLCVMRTSDGLGNSPMYLSRSGDLGVTWTKPEPFVRAGVLPRLLQLDNGVIVLAAGRPGVQLRFSIGSNGAKWTDPFEMLLFKNEKDEVSCGYTEMLVTGPDRFLLVYSDFKYQNKAGEFRKAIKVREIIVTPK